MAAPATVRGRGKDEDGLQKAEHLLSVIPASAEELKALGHLQLLLYCSKPRRGEVFAASCTNIS